MVNALPVSTTTAASRRRAHGRIAAFGYALDRAGRIDFGFKNKLRRPRVGVVPFGEAQVVKEAKRATAAPGPKAMVGAIVVPSACPKQRNCITLAGRVMPRRFSGPLPETYRGPLAAYPARCASSFSSAPKYHN